MIQKERVFGWEEPLIPHEIAILHPEYIRLPLSFVNKLHMSPLKASQTVHVHVHSKLNFSSEGIHNHV